MANRIANATIKGYNYQFLKSIMTILESSEDEEIILEGVIEDIDVNSNISTAAIQCKYYEGQEFKLSLIIKPVLEMLCNFSERSAIGKQTKYVLFAYFKSNNGSITKENIIEYLSKTSSQEIITTYFHKLYTITDSTILTIANKKNKTVEDKNKLITYYTTNRKNLKLRVDIDSFFSCFTYEEAVSYELLKTEIISQFSEISDSATANNLYFPNAFSIVSSLSSNEDINKRKITKNILMQQLENKKEILINKWLFYIYDKGDILKKQKNQLSSLFSNNTDVRAFIFCDKFLSLNKNSICTFTENYLNKYYKKKKLQKPPIFILGSNNKLLNDLQLHLYNYQKTYCNGMIGGDFIENEFVNPTNCSQDYCIKLTEINNISKELLKKCHVNQLFIVGYDILDFIDNSYTVKQLNIDSVKELNYLIGITKVLEE